MIEGEQITMSDYLAELDTPRNVQRTHHFMCDPICPHCRMILYNYKDSDRCPNCGQRLAWKWYHEHFDED